MPTVLVFDTYKSAYTAHPVHRRFHPVLSGFVAVQWVKCRGKTRKNPRHRWTSRAVLGGEGVRLRRTFIEFQVVSFRVKFSIFLSNNRSVDDFST